MTKEELEKLKKAKEEKQKKVINGIDALLATKNKMRELLLKQKETLKNTLNEEAAAKIDAAISEREEEIKYLTQLKQDATDAPDDKSDEVMAKLAELQDKVKAMEDKSAEDAQAANTRIKNFINSKDAIKEFNKVVQNARNKEQFIEAWRNVLIKNNITPTDIMLPGLVVQAISDGWNNETGRFMQMLNWSGLKHFKSLLEIGTGNTSKAHRHEKGTDKVEQGLSFYPIELRPNTLYKYVRIDKETEREDEDGVLIKYITQELVKRIGALAANQVVTGEDDDNNLFGCCHGLHTWTTYTVTDTSEALIYSCGVAADKVRSGGKKVLVIGADNYTKLRTVKWNIDNATGGGENVLLNREQTAVRVGVDDIIVLDEFSTFNGIDDGMDALALVLDVNAYMVVGDRNVEEYRDFQLSNNMNEYLAEMYIGGGLTEIKSACYVIKASPEA